MSRVSENCPINQHAVRLTKYQDHYFYNANSYNSVIATIVHDPTEALRGTTSLLLTEDLTLTLQVTIYYLFTIIPVTRLDI